MTYCTTQDVTERVGDDVSHVALTATVIAVTQTLDTTLSSWTIAHFPVHRVAAQHIRGGDLHRRSFTRYVRIVLGQKAAGPNDPEGAITVEIRQV